MGGCVFVCGGGIVGLETWRSDVTMCESELLVSALSLWSEQAGRGHARWWWWWWQCGDGVCVCVRACCVCVCVCAGLSRETGERALERCVDHVCMRIDTDTTILYLYTSSLSRRVPYPSIYYLQPLVWLSLCVVCMYVCTDSAAPAHARRAYTRTQARGATPELGRVANTTPHA